MTLIRFTLAVLALATASLAGPCQAAGAFSDWAAIVVAGDNHASGGGVSEVFDNGRRDLARALTEAGFAPDNVLQFSIQADRYPDPKPLSARPFRNLVEQFAALTQKARGGCLLYFTSHGSPDGIVLGDGLLSPPALASLIDDNCGKRPTVAVVSACFSGVFVADLEWPNRMVMTAARPDRTSFGCGATDRYTYFDECFLKSLSNSKTLQDLSAAVPVCVAQREKAERMAPPSEPQVSIGPQMRASLPLYNFTKPPN